MKACQSIVTSAPRARGRTLATGLAAERARGFPAHAGMDHIPSPRVANHPTSSRARVAGNGPSVMTCSTVPKTVAPRARAWTGSAPDDLGLEAGTPRASGRTRATGTPSDRGGRRRLTA